MVAPERLLNLLWTIIGGLGFLFFAFSIAPEAINSLPSVPNGFLELMGVSAAGYVGGKVARGPGPNIQAIVMDPPDRRAAGTEIDPLLVQIDGANLATEGAAYLMAQVRPALNQPDTPVQLIQPFRADSVVDANTGNADQDIDRVDSTETCVQGRTVSLHHRQSGRRESSLGVRRDLGLKLGGASEWLVEKHGTSRRRGSVAKFSVHRDAICERTR